MDDDSYNQSLSLTMDDSMLPRHWQKLCDGKYCKVEVGANGLGQVTITLVVEPDKSVSAFVRVSVIVGEAMTIPLRIKPLTMQPHLFNSSQCTMIYKQ